MPHLTVLTPGGAQEASRCTRGVPPAGVPGVSLLLVYMGVSPAGVHGCPSCSSSGTTALLVTY